MIYGAETLSEQDLQIQLELARKRRDDLRWALAEAEQDVDALAREAHLRFQRMVMEKMGLGERK